MGTTAFKMKAEMPNRLTKPNFKKLLVSYSFEEALDCVFHQRTDCHRSDSARNRSDDRGFRSDIIEVNISDKFAGLGITADSHIDDYDSIRNHICSNKMRMPGRNDKNLGFAGDGRKIDRMTVGNGHRSVLIHEKARDRHADDVAPADHDGAFPLNGNIGFFQHPDYALGSTRKGAGTVLVESGKVQRMESVDIFFLRNGRDYFVLGDMTRKRQLDKYAVDAVVCIEFCDKGEKFVLSDCDKTANGCIFYAYKGGSLSLAGDIGFACRVIPDKNDYKVRHTAIFFGEGCDLGGKFSLDAG